MQQEGGPEKAVVYLEHLHYSSFPKGPGTQMLGL